MISARTSPRSKALWIFGWILLPCALAGMTAVVLMNWRIPTQIQAELVLSRVVFILEGMDEEGARPVPILEKLTGFRSLTLAHFTRTHFSPQQLDIVGGLSEAQAKKRINWIKNLPPTGELILLQEQDRRPVMTVQSADDHATLAGQLASVAAKPGSTVTFEANAGSPASVTLKLGRVDTPPAISPVNPVILRATNVTSNAWDAAQLMTNAVTLRVKLREDRPLIQVENVRGAWGATWTPAENTALVFLTQTGASIRSIDFSRQNINGDIETAVKHGEIHYPDDTYINPVLIDGSTFLKLDQLENARIKQLRFDPRQAQFELIVTGEAGNIQTRSGDVTKDLRRTQFDRIWYDPGLAIIFGIVLWVCSLTVAVYKMYREEKNRVE